MSNDNYYRKRIRLPRTGICLPIVEHLEGLPSRVSSEFIREALIYYFHAVAVEPHGGQEGAPAAAPAPVPGKTSAPRVSLAVDNSSHQTPSAPLVATVESEATEEGYVAITDDIKKEFSGTF